MNCTKKSAVTELSAFYALTKKKEKQEIEGRNFYSLTYRYRGKVIVEGTGEPKISEKGSVTFVPKGLCYKTEVPEEAYAAVIHFKLDRDVPPQDVAVIPVNNENIRLLFEKILRNLQSDTSADFRCMACFYELLAILEERSGQEQQNRIPEKIRIAKEFMKQNYQNPAISVDGIAFKFKVSPSYLRREFFRAYKISPIAYLRTLRIESAKNMLESGNLSVTEIAEQCGFSGTSYFIQVFHKALGESPNQYRKNMIE